MSMRGQDERDPDRKYYEPDLVWDDEVEGDFVCDEDEDDLIDDDEEDFV